MSEQERCGNCRYRDTISSGHQQIQSVCRRHPPGVVEHRGQYFGNHGNAIWPAVASFDWCGEWKPAKETLTTDPT